MRLTYLCLVLGCGGCSGSWLPVLSLHAAVTTDLHTSVHADGGTTAGDRALRSTWLAQASWRLRSAGARTGARTNDRVARRRSSTQQARACATASLCIWERTARARALRALEIWR